jgi:diketogulonate reductase-like aldo/keto reductase
MGRAPPDGQLLSHATVTGIASDMGKSPAQVLVRWALQRYAGTLISIPKSSNPGRIADNADVYDWELSEEAIAALDQLDCGFRCFSSYLKTPENAVMWHDGKVEKGDESDFV